MVDQVFYNILEKWGTIRQLQGVFNVVVKVTKTCGMKDNKLA